MKNKNLSNRPQNKNFGDRAGRIQSQKTRKLNEQQYFKNPKHCKHCGTILSYEDRHNTFCNRSCSASYNNVHREVINRKNASNIKTKNGKQIFCKVTFNLCPTCNNYFRVKGGRRIYCSVSCNPSFTTKKAYRSMCKFKLNPNHHPTLYNVTLINQYGWYNPTNRKGDTNLDGVCWDHLFRIEDGYKNRILPEIISHPANAELVPWKVNISRKFSQITYEELLERIDQWNTGNLELPIFYSI